MGAPATQKIGGNLDDCGDDLKKPSAVAIGCSNDGCASYLSLIQQYLSVFMVDNATFLAERCVAEYPSSQDAVYMLALCYYRAGSPKTARQVLERGVCCGASSSSSSSSSGSSSSSSSSSMQYLSAQCSFDLNEYSRAEEALLRECRAAYKQNRACPDSSVATLDDWILNTTPCPVPNGAAGLALLGDICRQSNRKARACKYYKMSLKLDPFLWTSFESLAQLGATDLDASEVFGVQPSAATAATAANPPAVADSSFFATKTPLQPMETPIAGGGTGHGKASHHHLFQPSSLRPRSVHFDTPGLTPIPINSSSVMPAAAETPKASTSVYHASATANNPAILRRAREVASRQYYPPSPETPMTTVTRSMRYLRGLGAASATDNSYTMTNGGRTAVVGTGTEGGRSLFVTARTSENQASNRAGGNAMGNNNQGAGDNGAAGSDILGKPSKTTTPEKVQEILELLAAAGAAYQRLCQYKCREALQLLSLLPQRQQATGWALHQQGRAYLELNDYSSAQRCLEFMQVQDPGRMQGLELLSTAYWQLKKEVELAHLAQRVLDWDRLSPEAWCVVGNCFSLQKDHETALVFFGRSLQLDPDFTYTHTLSGYEYMANEDFDKATACFRQALRTDERHYNAWYGLGAIYHRQEKFDLAEYHFERAVSIHPGSSLLRCNLGIAQYANGKAYQALDTLSEAFRLEPRNPQARFQRATIYSALHRPEEALVELQKVRDAAPREATVHFAMGKVLKRLGRPEQAMKCFLTAMDLDPKDNQLIKSAMDKLDEPEVDEETMAAF